MSLAVGCESSQLHPTWGSRSASWLLLGMWSLSFPCLLPCLPLPVMSSCRDRFLSLWIRTQAQSTLSCLSCLDHGVYQSNRKVTNTQGVAWNYISCSTVLHILPPSRNFWSLENQYFLSSALDLGLLLIISVSMQALVPLGNPQNYGARTHFFLSLLFITASVKHCIIPLTSIRTPSTFSQCIRGLWYTTRF